MPDDEGTTAADLSARIDELNALVLRLSASPSPAPTSSPLPARPFSALRSALFSGSENPETFINDLERHYRLNAPFFASIDDSRRVDEARTAMSGAAAVWFDNLARTHPPTTWSAFLDEFRRVYLSARGLDNEFDRLRSLRMTGPIQEFVAEFNARLARCENTPSRSAICDFRRALPPSLFAELERSRVTRFGGSTEWPNLVEIQSAAAALIAATPRPTPLSAHTAAATLMPSPAPSQAPSYARASSYSSMLPSTLPPTPPISSTPSSTFSPTPPTSSTLIVAVAGTPADILRRREIADDRERRGLCRYCGLGGHRVDRCPSVAEKEARKREGKA